MNVRKRAVRVDRRRSAARAAWLSLLAFALLGLQLGTSTCGGAALDVLVPCDDNRDCTDHLGTECVDGRCVCNGADLKFCGGMCRLKTECSDAGDGGNGGGGNGGSGTGTCATAANCKQPGNPRCGKATCIDGTCGLDLKPLGPIASQLKGDCKYVFCDGDGNLVEFLESSDFYDDGAQCVTNSCQGDQPTSLLVPNGNTCPETGTGVCYQGECVACIDDEVSCSGNLVCHGVYCVPLHCVNNQWDQGTGEMAKDCGGPCQPCDTGMGCKVGTDCTQKVCSNGVCQTPTCSDGVRNSNETGVDCGGKLNCPPCASGQGCKAPSDCLGGVCWAGVCEAPSCTDGVINGSETGVDCGGPCEACP